MRSYGLVGLAAISVVALVGFGDAILGSTTPENPAQSKSVCDSLKFALEHAKTGFMGITGAQTTLPYSSGKELATKYATPFKLPDADECHITRYTDSLPQIVCSFASHLDVTHKKIEDCLIGLGGGWVNDIEGSKYTDWTGFKSPNDISIFVRGATAGFFILNGLRKDNDAQTQ